MKRILKPIIAVLEIVLGWRIFEWLFWDRRLFRDGAKNVGSAEAAKLIESKPDLQIVDVRSAREIAGGILPGASHVPIGKPEFEKRAAAGLDLEKPTLVYCAGGIRSRKAVAAMKELGFGELYNLHRGFLSWNLGRGETEKS
ncbi:MAG: rhodanese-related sulfurtransferase [Verrucomicrobiales bacterium]|jgi:rhodanese-related sulfurtransferase